MTSSSEPKKTDNSKKTDNNTLDDVSIDDLADDILNDENESKESKQSNKTDFSGIWELEQNINVQKFAEEMGVIWLVRKALPYLSMKMTISQDLTTDKLDMTMNPKNIPFAKEVKTTYEINNKPLEQKNAKGEVTAMATSKWIKDYSCIEIAVTNDKDPSKNVTLNLFKDKEKLVLLATNVKGTQNKRIFKKIG